jgi:hypothetical protein
MLCSRKKVPRALQWRISGCSRRVSCHCGAEAKFPSLETKVSWIDASLGSLQCRSCGLGKASGGSVQGAKALVNQGEERFERVSRAKFNVDTPDAGRQAGANLKESQPNLADRGHFEFGAS